MLTRTFLLIQLEKTFTSPRLIRAVDVGIARRPPGDLGGKSRTALSGDRFGLCRTDPGIIGLINSLRLLIC